MTTTMTKKHVTVNAPVRDDENVLSIYLKEINRIPLLTREEEVEHARRVAAGDEASKEVLINANLRFVVNVAKKYQNQGLPLSDLISEGNIGLMNAIDRFDVEKGYHFISYAVWWIRQAILKAICEKSRMIRLPLNRANELVQIEKVRKEITGTRGEEAELREIARTLDMTPEHVADLVGISRDMISLETPVYNEKDSSMLGDFIEDKQYVQPEALMIERALKTDIDKALTTLTEKEADIIRFRFGLNGRSPLSLKEIGDRYGLTKERIRQIEKKALRQLQSPRRAQYLEAYVA
ncbi:RNA polymerase primary sigma factor [Alkalispirochaeta americana]|uniref:RNA polymerase sigma factor n=1 Tax=Alkalispirochaeta americana TaxID=159291 RepID=A0A1N6UXK7_9SPIO|nr:RNA polymerase sigma factor RpoD/SigA [Alkalispirochaeta americana]SIQ70026.1 RNA polymerase primary sigma factor [Alkalispirochaeta americana]